MLYAREVIGLLQPFPGREFRMKQILRDVEMGHPPPDEKGRASMRRAVLRVLEQLQATGHVSVIAAQGRGGAAIYMWSAKSAT